MQTSSVTVVPKYLNFATQCNTRLYPYSHDYVPATRTKKTRCG